ncbi:serine hydrolase FSH [Aspergillus pseudocaelatus]|uniref:Serine hydrolase FSH n=1 Tax=Aspergillus pseudocaelatus TaxID=1825620 RepID=A0ABQ6WDS4_9EURO|nr:serine hydrolase FSH [Aspergillus pseudocaelatus]
MQILQQQTAAIRYELSDDYTYEFVEGAIPWGPSNRNAVHSEAATFTYCHPEQEDSFLRAIQDLERFFEDKGPFDGVIGFSMGASIAITWLKLKQEALNRGDITSLPVNVVILFSVSHVYDYKVVEKGNPVEWDPSHAGIQLDVPSVHIWGSQDPSKSLAQRGTEFFRPDKLSTYVHERGHEIPSSMEEVPHVVKATNRAIAAISRV